jgi:alkanesulfonate monooxygenase SsuD/methylene tetrahydromethanopterin reductase-like flavin-dependent oxidoreductase (luciferase family)
MQFSVWPNSAHPPSETLDIARWAEANGWCGIWYADHYMPNTGTEAVASGPVHECWAVLPAIAAVTQRIRLGPLVSPTSVHHPAVLANRAITIDHLSAGRFVLGLGAGWQINEHRAFGIELEPPGRRVHRFDEAIQIIRSLLVEERTTFDGGCYTITDAPSEPKPVQSPLPLLVGTGSPRMLRITARHADEWNTWGTPEMAAARRREFLAACAAVDRDPGSMRTSVQALLAITASDADADRARSGPMGERTIAGTAQQLVDHIGEYRAMGFDEFIVPNFNLGATPTQRQEALERIGAEVVAHIS